MGSELELELESWKQSCPFFNGSGSSQKRRLRLHNADLDGEFLSSILSLLPLDYPIFTSVDP